MVRAILDGRKTVTRRIVKPQPTWGSHESGTSSTFCAEWKGRLLGTEGARDWFLAQCPYGQQGDRLWVRETHMRVPHPSEFGLTREMLPHTWDACCEVAGTFLYRADPCSDLVADGRHWTPSIHMPRAASRITLEVTGVRVERLQDITEEQAQAEGVAEWARGALSPAGQHELSAVGQFAMLWDQINGTGSWDANSWVWAVEFKRVAQERKVA